MNHRRLAKVIEQYKIKTVIDVRAGRDEPAEDGMNEEKAVISAGAAYHHFPLVGSQVPSSATVKELLKLYDKVETPILLHDSSGTHRAGVCSTIWLLTKENVHILEAEKQLSLRFGFFRWERDFKSYLQGADTIDNLIWQFKADTKDSAMSFREWIDARENGAQIAPPD